MLRATGRHAGTARHGTRHRAAVDAVPDLVHSRRGALQGPHGGRKPPGTEEVAGEGEGEGHQAEHFQKTVAQTSQIKDAVERVHVKTQAAKEAAVAVKDSFGQYQGTITALKGQLDRVDGAASQFEGELLEHLAGDERASAQMAGRGAARRGAALAAAALAAAALAAGGRRGRAGACAAGAATARATGGPLAAGRAAAAARAGRRGGGRRAPRAGRRAGEGQFQPPEPYGPLFELRPEGGLADSALIWLHCGAGNGAVASWTVGADLREALPSTSLLFPTGTVRLPFPRWVAFGYDEVNKAMENTSALLDFGHLGIMQESVRYVHALVDREIARGIRPERIFVAGFSNGGAAALAAGLSYQARLGGVLGASTFLLGRPPERDGQLEAAPPVHLFHGGADPVVPVEWAHHSRKVLDDAGLSVSLKVYPGMWHSRCEEETLDMLTLIRGTLMQQKS
ncbi:unnamed protein product [Prorocentrum cordatum]|uniref:Phospholipase/carboxylesterase/thioesterase domain-containing protein n=1 Tax=Prorocentrum cordatum TaxID=2364126 RepID=A0ABN9VRD6_9DINO|nr:unnamed protein product [Polarella glacialis]